MPHSNPTSENKGASPSLLGAVIMLCALTATLMPLLVSGIFSPPATITDCRNQNASLSTLTGSLRKAGQDYYLVGNERWHLLQSHCTGKVRQTCLDASGHAEVWLEAHLGETVTAHICAHGVVDYTVAGRAFIR